MAPPTRVFDIPKNDSGGVIQIRIQEPDIRTENLTLATWGSSFILASRLHKVDIGAKCLQSAKSAAIGPVLELGAGTGVVGLAAAALWGTSVVLTDLAPIVPGLATNISLNNSLVSAARGRASCGALDWAAPHELSLAPDTSADGNGLPRNVRAETNKVSIVLAADTVYSEEHPALLAKAILTWLRPGPHSRLLITYPVRTAYLDEIKELWERLERIGLVALEEGKEWGDDSWDDERLHEWSVWTWRTEEDG